MIILTLALALILRLLSLNQSLWLDEATTANVASNMSFGEIVTSFSINDFHPPLYYLFMKTWVSAFGASEISLRLPSVIFGVGVVYLIYKMFGKLPALLVASAPLLIYYSQEARMYSMATFLVTLATYLFVKINKSGRVGDYLAFSLTLAAISATNYLSLLIIPVFWLWGIINKKKITWWKKFITSHIPLVIFFILWFPILAKQFGIGLNVAESSPLWANVLGGFSLKNTLLIPIKFMIGRISIESNLIYGLTALTLTTFFGYLLIRAKKSASIVWLWFILPLLLGTLISVKVPVLSYFRFIFVLPAFYVLVAEGINKHAKYKKLFIGTALLINLLFSFYYLGSPKFHREDWRGLSEAVGSDAVVFPADSQKEALTYYGKGSQIIDADEFKGLQESVWLSRYVWEIFDPQDSARIKLESLGYKFINQYNFNGVVFYKYEKDLE